MQYGLRVCSATRLPAFALFTEQWHSKIIDPQPEHPARAHGILFYVAAPSSTFDLSIKTGAEIPIEQRKPEEITHGFGRATAPEGTLVYNPAFDVAPAESITAIITGKGIIQPVTEENIRAILSS